jgi:hypothetical protein
MERETVLDLRFYHNVSTQILKSCYENECPSPDSSGNPLCFFFKNIKIAGPDSYRDSSLKNYSTFRITGSINCVFTGNPRLMAGFILGKSTKRAFKILSIFIVS